VESGRTEIQESVFSVSATFDDIQTITQRAAELAGTPLKVRVTPPDASLCADERLIKQALINLVTNSIKFSPRSGVIELSYSQEPGPRFTVVDHGVGIESSELARVMEPFGQGGDVMTRRADGVGLGLPLAASFIGLHGGSLSLSSEVGQGTRVTVDLPESRIRADKKRDAAARDGRSPSD
jgi:signal transduction histidine kinase